MLLAQKFMVNLVMLGRILDHPILGKFKFKIVRIYINGVEVEACEGDSPQAVAGLGHHPPCWLDGGRHGANP